MKRNFSGLTLKEAMQTIAATRLVMWQIDVRPQEPSPVLQEWLPRLRVFNQTTSEAAKILLIDAMLTEVVPNHAGLRIWKSAPLESDTMAGIADYLIAPDFAYLTTPLLCVVEAKKDDFDAGEVQCVAEMAACQWNNRQEGYEADVFGIVSNGQGWVFYKLTWTNEVYETALYAMNDLPRLLSVLNYVIAQCALNLLKA